MSPKKSNLKRKNPKAWQKQPKDVMEQKPEDITSKVDEQECTKGAPQDNPPSRRFLKARFSSPRPPSPRLLARRFLVVRLLVIKKRCRRVLASRPLSRWLLMTRLLANWLNRQRRRLPKGSLFIIANSNYSLGTQTL
jgi:hypothetical protein